MEATARKLDMDLSEELITKDSTINRIKEGLKVFKLKKIKGESEITYPMSLKYGQKDWNIPSSLREFISNAIDTKGSYNIIHNNGFAIISDSGAGLPKSAFIFGESERDNSQIGQFGEGLKMACLTLLRYGRTVWIETVGFTVLVEKVSSNDLISQIGNKDKKEDKSIDLMKFRYIPNEKTIGTDIFVECSEEELAESKNLFLVLNNLEKIDNNVFLPAGDIFILGLKTTRLPNTLFSYNIDDKRLTNRDRNIVETSKLQENIVSILKGAKNQKLIKEYLSSFSINPNAYEYQLSFLPDSKRKDTWIKILNKVYSSKAVLSTDVQSDHYATAMGYKVLRNVPSNVLNVIKYLGLKGSNEVAKDYKGEGLIKNNKMIFPISEDYIGSWSREDGIKEFIANSLDAGNKIRITHNGTEARISDNGVGILKKHFILGISQKDKTAIGQFGEGMKMACLVLARTNSPVKIETIKTTYEATLEYSEEFGAKLLVIYFNKNSRTKGTSIVFSCTESELENAKSMFAQFSGSRRKPISMGDMEVSFDNPGVIYSNGLETTKLNAIFSYNIKDKTIVSSRDRNGVDTYKLNNYIEKFLRMTTNEEAIMLFLTKWLTNTNYVEYRADFSPSDGTLWKKVIKKAFPKACFEDEYNSYSNDDFISKQAGYKILSNVPLNVARILKSIGGISSSSKIAPKYRNKGILLENKLIYPITSDFASNWSVSNAIQEIISNAIDTGAKTNISAKNGLITISDKGDGLSKRNLLFDGSSKSNEQIGQFGEGLKLASLVLARNNRDFKVVTKGFEYTAKIERDTEFNADVLVINLTKNKKRIGTDITFNGTEIELENVKNKFLVFNKDFKELDKNIYTEGGKLFVNGVFLQNIDSIFSYNITDAKDIVTRDRRSADIEKVKPIIGRLLSNAQNKKLIETFITNKEYGKLEHQLDINPSTSVRHIWKQVVEKVYSKCCFATGTDYDGVAKDKGFKLLFNLSQGLTTLLMAMGISSSDKVVTLKGDEKDIKKKFDPKNLSPIGKKRWKNALDLFSNLYGVRLSKRIELVETFRDGVETDSTWGLYNSKTDTIYILAELFENLKHTEEEITGVLIHEQVHRQSMAYDRTREFEFALSMELGRIAQMYIKLANKKAK